MPRFHFNVLDGVSILDEEGTEFPNWEEARTVAIRLAGEIFKDNAQHLSLGAQWRMEVTDEEGFVLFRMDFSVMEPAVRSRSAGHPTPGSPAP